MMTELLIQQIGFAITAALAPLAAALVVTITGSLVWWAYVRVRFGLPIREFDREMWRKVFRLAISNTMVGIAYILALQALGLPLVALIGAFGVLSVGFKVYWRCFGSARSRPDKVWALQHLGVRGVMLALVGIVLLFLGPLTGTFEGVDLLVGLVWAVVVAWCFWNYITVVFGPLKAQNTEEAPHKSEQGLAVANLLSIPAIALVIWPFGGWGELFSDFSLGNWMFAALAGVLTIAIPAHMQVWAATKGVSDRMAGVLYSLDTPIAALVGTVGVGLGLLKEDQMPNPLVLVAIAFMIGAGIRSTLMGDKPPSERTKPAQD